MMRVREAPAACAASMNGVAVTPSATERTVRAAVGVSKITRARITLSTDWPSAAMRESARMMGGSAIRQSTTRWLPASAAPPRYPVTAPHTAPRVMPNSTETTPT